MTAPALFLHLREDLRLELTRDGQVVASMELEPLEARSLALRLLAAAREREVRDGALAAASDAGLALTAGMH